MKSTFQQEWEDGWYIVIFLLKCWWQHNNYYTTEREDLITVLTTQSMLLDDKLDRKSDVIMKIVYHMWRSSNNLWMITYACNVFIMLHKWKLKTIDGAKRHIPQKSLKKLLKHYNLERLRRLKVLHLYIDFARSRITHNDFIEKS